MDQFSRKYFLSRLYVLVVYNQTYKDVFMDTYNLYKGTIDLVTLSLIRWI